MKSRLLFWLDKGFLYYGIAKHIQDKIDCEIYAIVSDSDNVRRFYQEQNFVNFTKVWFFYDETMLDKKKPDLDYLEHFEENYGINLWIVAASEKLFYRKYNQYYHFNDSEILQILEKECKFFERVLNEAKPDFLLINTISRHYAYLLYLLCKKKRIEILTIESPRLAGEWIITNELNKISDSSKFQQKYEPSSFTELQNYLKASTLYRYGYEYRKQKKISKTEKLSAMIKFLFSTRANDHNHYTQYGRTKFGILAKGTTIPFKLKRKYREYFMNRNFLSKIEKDPPFIYFPLHAEPERRILMDAPLFSEQIAVISAIAKCLPIRYLLYVKDHPLMRSWAWREINYYKQISGIPNVRLVSPSIPNEELLQKSSLVATIAGTAGLEAAFYGKPAIVFADVEYSHLSSVTRVKNMDDLPHIIRQSLKTKLDPSEIAAYLHLIDKISLPYDNANYGSDLYNRFYYMGYLQHKEVTVNAIKSFLEDYRDLFETLAVRNVEKMREYSIHPKEHT